MIRSGTKACGWIVFCLGLLCGLPTIGTFLANQDVCSGIALAFPLLIVLAGIGLIRESKQTE